MVKKCQKKPRPLAGLFISILRIALLSAHPSHEFWCPLPGGINPHWQRSLIEGGKGVNIIAVLSAMLHHCFSSAPEGWADRSVHYSPSFLASPVGAAGALPFGAGFSFGAGVSFTSTTSSTGTMEIPAKPVGFTNSPFSKAVSTAFSSL